MCRTEWRSIQVYTVKALSPSHGYFAHKAFKYEKNITSTAATFTANVLEFLLFSWQGIFIRASVRGSFPSQVPIISLPFFAAAADSVELCSFYQIVVILLPIIQLSRAMWLLLRELPQTWLLCRVSENKVEKQRERKRRKEKRKKKKWNKTPFPALTKYANSFFSSKMLLKFILGLGISKIQN